MEGFGLKFRFWLRYNWLEFFNSTHFIPEHPIFFIHIPKTAGTSFRSMLYRQIGQQYIFPNYKDLEAYEGFYPDLESLQGIYETMEREVKLFAGHYPFAAGELLRNPPQYFVFLREPVQRTISNLSHFRRNQPDCKNLDLIEIFNKHRLHLQNLQTRYLCDDSLQSLNYFRRPDLLSEKSLDQAKANLEKCTFVGITEQFSASILTAEKLLGTRLGNHLKKNVTPVSVGEQDNELISRLTPYLKLDVELYRYALELFENQQSRILK